MSNQDYKKILNERKKSQKYNTFNTPAFVVFALVFLILLAIWYSIFGVS